MSTRRKLTLALTLGIALAIAIAMTSAARDYAAVCFRSTTSEGTYCPGRLSAKFDAQVTPKKLPKHELTPVTFNLSGWVATSDGTNPSALRELTIDLDRNVSIDAKGLPACHPFRRYVRAESCRSASVGRGRADFEIAVPERAPVLAPARLIVFNGGVKAGVTTLFAIAYVTMPTPIEIITPVKIKKVHQGRYGLRAVARIPPVADGHGSLLGFNLDIKRLFAYRHAKHSYAMAKCPDGHLGTVITSLFRNETKTPGVPSQTTLEGTLVRPCA